MLQAGVAPLLIPHAPAEGAHPLGGPTLRFVMTANDGLAPLGHRILYHVGGPVPESDADCGDLNQGRARLPTPPRGAL